MMFEIDQQIIDQIRELCPKWMACLSGNMSFVCSVEEEGEEGLVVEPYTSFSFSNCPYSFKVNNMISDLYLCTCPARIEKYRKYGE